MRIVAGKHRGRRLKVPRGWPVRPTSDRVREATFDLLLHGDEAIRLHDSCVADVFAGTGALGFEALSRGAGHVVFVDANPRALDIIEGNATLLNEQALVTMLRRDARSPGSPPAIATAGCQLAFFDPPYDQDLLAPALSAFAENQWLAPKAVVVAEMAGRDAFAPPEQFTVIKERRYGGTRVVILAWAG